MRKWRDFFTYNQERIIYIQTNDQSDVNVAKGVVLS